MSNEIKRKRYSILNIVMLFIIGSVFIALGIGVFVALMISVSKAEEGQVDAFIAVPIILFVLIPIAFGSIAYTLSFKWVYNWVKDKKTNKFGKDTTAKIIDYNTVSHDGTVNKRFALVLEYELNGKTDTFTTAYIFDINELNYLKSLNKIKVKVDRGYVTVTEPFTKDIYKLDPHYGILLEFYKQKHVAKGLLVWRITFFVTLILLFISIALSLTLKINTYLIISIALLFSANFICSVVMAVFFIKFIKWIKRKKD